MSDSTQLDKETNLMNGKCPKPGSMRYQLKRLAVAKYRGLWHEKRDELQTQLEALEAMGDTNMSRQQQQEKQQIQQDLLNMSTVFIDMRASRDSAADAESLPGDDEQNYTLTLYCPCEPETEPELEPYRFQPFDVSALQTTVRLAEMTLRATLSDQEGLSGTQWLNKLTAMTSLGLLCNSGIVLNPCNGDGTGGRPASCHTPFFRIHVKSSTENGRTATPDVSLFAKRLLPDWDTHVPATDVLSAEQMQEAIAACRGKALLYNDTRPEHHGHFIDLQLARPNDEGLPGLMLLFTDPEGDRASLRSKVISYALPRRADQVGNSRPSTERWSGVEDT